MPEHHYNGPERRLFSRIPFWYIVQYKVCLPAKDNKHSKNEIISSRSKNISLGGILLETKRFYPASTMLEVEIDVPIDAENHIYAKVQGVVVRCSAVGDEKIFDTAIEFVSAPKECQSNIRKLINAFANA
jgi:hypothetical protein